jgi:hypothetical protein
VRLEIALDPHHDDLEAIEMPDLFQKNFRPSSKTKRSTLVNAPPSATPNTSTSHTSGDSTVNLNLAARPIVEGYQTDIQNERKQQCIAHAITTLELLKEIDVVNGVLSPLKAICEVTLVILNMIEVDLLLSRCCSVLIDVFRRWIVTRNRGRRCRILFINITTYLNRSATRRIWIR